MEALNPDEIFCVYCLKVKPRPIIGEHIILKGLGGHATIPDVCGGPKSCNQELGDTLDREVLRESFIALHRYYAPNVNDGQLGGIQFMPSKLGGYFDLKVFNDGDVKLPPQLAVTEKGVVIAVEHEEKAAADSVLAAFKGIETVFKEDVRDVAEYEPPRIVLNMSKKGLHLIRGRNQTDVDKVKDVLRRGFTVQYSAKAEDVVEPEFRVRVSMEPNTTSRCIVKMAFNMATAVFGAEAMVRPEFNPIRDFIWGIGVNVKPIRQEADGRLIVDLDDRYIDDWTKDRQPEAVGSPEEHTIVLLELDGQLGARVVLFGGAEWFQVRLGPLEGLDRARLPASLVSRTDDDYWYVNAYVVPNGHLKGLDASIDRAFNWPKSPKI
jgi:hypothetical protein